MKVIEIWVYKNKHGVFMAGAEGLTWEMIPSVGSDRAKAIAGIKGEVTSFIAELVKGGEEGWHPFDFKVEDVKEPRGIFARMADTLTKG